MCTGGRIVHHLMQRLSREEDTILFVGYQAKGTRGRNILEKDDTIRMFGQNVPLRCQVTQISGLSARRRPFRTTRLGRYPQRAPPAKRLSVHGELDSAKAMKQLLTTELGWKNVHVPDYLDEFTLFEE